MSVRFQRFRITFNVELEALSFGTKYVCVKEADQEIILSLISA